MTKSVYNYLLLKVDQYNSKMSELRLFSRTNTLDWLQKQTFAIVFYHIRGHFSELIWLLGNFAPSVEYKQILLQNIAEEFGGTGISHEQMYLNFVNSFISTIRIEIAYENLQKLYEDSSATTFNRCNIAKRFNTKHQDFLKSSSSWASKWALFCTYEYLDKVDYDFLLKMLKNRLSDVNGVDFTFFEVHARADHFHDTRQLLEKSWFHEPQEVKKGIDFTLNTQLTMWTQLSESVR